MRCLWFPHLLSLHPQSSPTMCSPMQLFRSRSRLHHSAQCKGLSFRSSLRRLRRLLPRPDQLSRSSCKKFGCNKVWWQEIRHRRCWDLQRLSQSRCRLWSILLCNKQTQNLPKLIWVCWCQLVCRSSLDVWQLRQIVCNCRLRHSVCNIQPCNLHWLREQLQAEWRRLCLQALWKLLSLALRLQV